jgi:hypothetical protein
LTYAYSLSLTCYRRDRHEALFGLVCTRFAT